MRTDGYDEAKRPILQLRERALKIGSSQQLTCDVISNRYYQFVSVVNENLKFCEQRPFSSRG
jgi:hypothetical protein